MASLGPTRGIFMHSGEPKDHEVCALFQNGPPIPIWKKRCVALAFSRMLKTSEKVVIPSEARISLCREKTYGIPRRPADAGLLGMTG